MSRAWKQLGGQENELLEVNLQGGPEHNMLLDSGPYAGLLRSIWEGKLLALVGGPNCRTRSVMRRIPVDWHQAPRPVRRWGNEEEHGIKDATPEEVRGIQEKMGFGLEQPASPKSYKPEVVSWWDTMEWEKLKEEFGWEEVTFRQKPLGGAAVKTTTMGGNLSLHPEDHQVSAPRHVEVKGSWVLARWPPDMMTMVANAVMTQCLKKKPKVKHYPGVNTLHMAMFHLHGTVAYAKRPGKLHHIRKWNTS